MRKIKVLLTGVTGMVGEGVLLACLDHPQVEAVTILGRRSAGYSHPKVTEIVHPDLYDVGPIATQLQGFDTCYFCLGASSVGMKEPEYFKVTYTLTMGIAKVLLAQNPTMEFCYISGAGTHGNSMWARVKSKTESDLSQMGFSKEYNFRPGLLDPTKGQKNVLSMYKWFGWLYPVVRKLMPASASTLQELGLAMINSTLLGYEKNTLEVLDIVKLAAQKPQAG